MAVDHPGLYDLRALGHSAPIVLTDRHAKSAFIPYRITKEAHRKYPYARVFLRFKIRIAERTRAGAGYVDLITGDGPSAMAEFLTRRKQDRLHIRWSTTDVNGQTSHNTTHRTIKVDYPNYMAFDDATAGKHRLRFKLEHYEGFHVDWVKINPRSGIALTAKSPYAAVSVNMSAKAVSGGPVRVGRPMTILVQLRNPGSEPATNVPVDLRPDSGLRIVGAEAHRRWPRIDPGKTAQRRIQIIPLTPGRHRLAISSRVGHQASAGDLVFATTPSGGRAADGGGPSWLWIALGASAAAAGIWRLRITASSRRRRNDRSDCMFQ